MNRFLFLSFFSLCSHLKAAELDSYRERFEQELTELTEKKTKAIHEWERWYVQSLLELKNSYRALGKLDPILAIDEESTRFLESRNLPDPFSSFERLSALQTEARTRLNRLAAIEKAETKRIVTRYDLVLQELEKMLTRSNRIEEALQVRQERTSLPDRYPALKEPDPETAITPKPPERNPGQRFQIISARYGGREKYRDVTEKVREAVKDDSLTIRSSNALAGDPAPGVVKNLEVTYRHQGQEKTISVREGEVLTLP
jgi:hypothetical protein